MNLRCYDAVQLSKEGFSALIDPDVVKPALNVLEGVDGRQKMQKSFRSSTYSCDYSACS